VLGLEWNVAAPPRFEHGFEAPQASVISKLHYRAASPQSPPQYKREGDGPCRSTRVHGRGVPRPTMVLELERTVEFSMVDLANIAYYPRIFDLAHRFFEATWPSICGQTYPQVLYERRIGFPVLNVDATFHHPLRYGDTITARITVPHLGTTSLAWRYRFYNQDGTLVWSSRQTTVCVDMDSMDKLPLPDDIRAGLEKHFEAEDEV